MSPANETPEASFRSSEPEPCEYNSGQHCYHPGEGCCICQDPAPVQPPAPDPVETCGGCGHDAHTTALCTAQVHPCCDCGEDDGTLGPDSAAPDPDETPSTHRTGEGWDAERLEWYETTCPCPDPLRAVNPICQTHGYLPAPVPPATTGPADEAEGLAVVLAGTRVKVTGVGLLYAADDGTMPLSESDDPDILAQAHAVLASNWLAARDARTRADALWEAADEVGLDLGSGYDATDDARASNAAARWLRDRADQIGGAS